MVVKSIMEEHVSIIYEVIKLFCTNIEELGSSTFLGTPPEEKEQRKNNHYNIICEYQESRVGMHKDV
jgi:hypothetical protein